MAKIAVLGSGSWGSVLASMLSDNGQEVVLFGNNEKVAKEINTAHTNSHYMKNWSLNPDIKATLDLKKAAGDAEIVLFVLPTKAIRSVAHQLSEILMQTGNRPLLVSATKGIEPGSKKLVSDILGEEVYPDDPDKIIVISGPSHAENVAQHDLTAITCASVNQANAQLIQSLFSNDYVRLYTNTDVIGVEVGGAVKNVIALAAGILAGKNFGDNAKAALMTRGLAEMTRLGVSFGAQPLTFGGLSGIGDLIVTCTSVNSRNWRAGKQLGEGHSLKEVLQDMGQVVEGATTVKAVHELCLAQHIEMPICEAVYRVLYQDSQIDEEIKQMMGRSRKAEQRL